MIVLIRTLNGQWRWHAGLGSGIRQDVEQAFRDAEYAYRASTAKPSYGKCIGDDRERACWCGRGDHIEVNATVSGG